MSRFDSEKAISMKDYKIALENSSIDQRVIPALAIVNSHPDYFSTSSCSGRVMLLSLAYPGAKNESLILSKWHEKFNKEQLMEGIDKWDKYRYLFLFAQSAIFHIIARDLNKAVELRNLGELAGFKYSTLRSIKPLKKAYHGDNTNTSSSSVDIDNILIDSRITVELLSTERLNVPIGLDNKILVNDEYFDVLLELSNDAISKTHEKIVKLENVLSEKINS
jgi:tRNA wybutosine-synthesizing protein 3